MEYVPGIELGFNFEEELKIEPATIAAVYHYFLEQHENERLAQKLTQASVLKALSPYFKDIAMIVPSSFYQDSLGQADFEDPLNGFEQEPRIPEVIPTNLITYQLDNYIKEQLEKLEILIANELTVANVHDIRVTIKRLLVIKNHYGVYLKKKIKKLIGELKPVFKSLGPVRDMDILYELTLQKELKAKRMKYQDHAAKLIAKQNYARKIDKMVKKQYYIKKISNCQGPVLCFKADLVNANVIAGLADQIQCAGIFFDKDYLPLCAYHRLRLVFKELKYVLEICGYLDGALYRDVKVLTELLGNIHDNQNKIDILKMAIEDTQIRELTAQFNLEFKKFIKS